MPPPPVLPHSPPTSVPHPPRSRREPTRGQPGDTAQLHEVDGLALALPHSPHTSTLHPFRSRGEPTRVRRSDIARLREVDRPALAPHRRLALPSPLAPPFSNLLVHEGSRHADGKATPRGCARSTALPSHSHTHLTPIQPSRSRGEPTRGQRGDTARLREIDGLTIAPPPRTPLAPRSCAFVLRGERLHPGPPLQHRAPVARPGPPSHTQTQRV
ncbi:hypothetical protein BKA93DRAFT_111699 [Sparassis latifolia]